MNRIACVMMLLAATTAVAAGPALRIEHVTIVSPEREKPLRDATVYIREGRILSVSAGSGAKVASASTAITVVDGRGLYLIPGLIDSHVHTAAVNGMSSKDEAAQPDIARAAREQIPRSYLYFGFTTLVDLDSSPEPMARWNANAIRPDTFFCGGAPVVDGYPTMWEPKEQRYQRRYLIVQKGDEAKAPEGVDPAAHTPEAVVGRMKADGMYCVKTFYDERAFGPSAPSVPRLETLRALVKAAHAAHMPVFVHALSTDAQSIALQSGADVIAHGLWEWNGEAEAVELTPKVREVLDEVVRKKMAWQPTMQVGYGFRDLYDPGYLASPLLARVLPAALIDWYATTEGQWFRNQMAQGLPKDLAEMTPEARWEWARSSPAFVGMFSRTARTTKYLASHDGRVIFGTDSPCAPLYTNPPGLNGWKEMNHLAEAGLTPVQIFRAATLVNAEAIRLSHEIGTVEAGKRANLLLVRQDPTQSIEAYDQIEKVILRGQVIDREELSAKRADP